MRGKKYFVYAIFIFAVLGAFNLIFFSLPLNYTSHATEQGTVSLSIEVTPGEEPSPAPSASSGGGGGGGAVIVEEPEGFSVDKDIIKIKIKQGSSFKTPIKITSLIEDSQDVQINVIGLDGMISISDKSFSISGRGEKIVNVDFFSFNELEPGVYTGKISITNGKQIKEILVTFEVKSEVILFDVSLDIPEGYREISPGEEILAQLTLFNLDEIEGVNVSIDYEIKDFFGEVLLSQREDVIVSSDRTSFTRNFNLPSGIGEGDYVLAVKVRYNHSFATASEIFHVVVDRRAGFYIMGAIIAGLFLYLIWRISKKKKIIRIVSRARGEKKLGQKKEALETSKKLKKQLSILDRAIKGGHISEKSYSKGKSNAKKVARKLKKKSL